MTEFETTLKCAELIQKHVKGAEDLSPEEFLNAFAIAEEINSLKHTFVLTTENTKLIFNSYGLEV